MGDGSGYYTTTADYLAAERTRTERHEFLAGFVYRLARPNLGHSRITANLLGELRQQLAGRSYEAFSADLKVRIRTNTAEFYYYPDVTIDCSGIPDAAHFAEQPRVIVEVLSPETERIDRGEKLRNYLALPSLDAYVLVDQHRVAVTVYRRNEGGFVRELWTEKDDSLALPTIGCNVALAAIYERTGL